MAKVKTREYTITTGAYDSYKILCRISGPATPALSTIWKEFETQYGLSVLHELNKLDVVTKIHKQIATKDSAISRLHKDGYEGYNVAECFVDWLLKNHGFSKLKSEEFYI